MTIHAALPRDQAASRDDSKDARLRIIQQPIRARACGFGEKDRRPITPPLIVKLDFTRGSSPLAHSEYDTTRFILAADVRHADTLEDANVVPSVLSTPSGGRSQRLQASGSPQRVNATKSSLLSSHERDLSRSPPPPLATPLINASTSLRRRSSGLVTFDAPQVEDGKPSIVGDSADSHAPVEPLVHRGATSPPTKKRRRSNGSDQAPPPPLRQSSPLVVGDRVQDEVIGVPNLIGTLHANSYSLNDPDPDLGAGPKGIFFVLPDLSVRTEGKFRLRLRLVSIDFFADPGSLGNAAPVVASVYSDEFQVYSAKKFPGMLEPTALSKHFAAQGVRIPTRQTKSTRGGGGGGGGGGGEEGRRRSSEPEKPPEAADPLSAVSQP